MCEMVLSRWKNYSLTRFLCSVKRPFYFIEKHVALILSFLVSQCDLLSFRLLPLPTSVTASNSHILLTGYDFLKNEGVDFIIITLYLYISGLIVVGIYAYWYNILILSECNLLFILLGTIQNLYDDIYFRSLKSIFIVIFIGVIRALFMPLIALKRWQPISYRGGLLDTESWHQSSIREHLFW